MREAFEQELGFRVNRERLELAIARAAEAGPGLPPSFRKLLDIAERGYAAMKPAAPEVVAEPAKDAFDLVMFWKQNDSGIYGRRSDMMMKHLLASGRVRRVLQLDQAFSSLLIFETFNFSIFTICCPTKARPKAKAVSRSLA